MPIAKTKTKTRTKRETTTPSDELRESLERVAELRVKAAALQLDLTKTDLFKQLSDTEEELREIETSITQEAKARMENAGPAESFELTHAGLTVSVSPQRLESTVVNKGGLVNYLRKKASSQEDFLKMLSIGVGTVRKYVPENQISKFLREEKSGRRDVAIKTAKK